MTKLFTTILMLASCSKDEPLYVEQPAVNFVLNDTLTGLTFYPNPFASTLNFTFNLSESDSINYMLFDVMGRTLIEKKILAFKNANQLSLQLDTLDNGVYFVQVHAFNRFYIRKVVKVN